MRTSEKVTVVHHRQAALKRDLSSLINDFIKSV